MAQAVCVRTASAAVLDGSIASLGSQYILGLRAKNCSTGDILADEQAQAARKEDVLGCAQSDGDSVPNAKLGESLATIEKYSTPLEEATTPSLGALKAYSAAMEGVLFIRPRAGRAAVRACGRDRSRILRWPMRSSGFYYSDAGRVGAGAAEHGQGVPVAPSRQRRRAILHRDVVRPRRSPATWNGSTETLEAWAQTYPRDPMPHGLLAGFATRSTGKYELSIAAAERSMALDPDGGSAPSYNSKAYSELYLNRLDAAEATIRRAEERKLDLRLFPGSLLHRVLARRWRRHASAGRAGQSQSLHGRLDLAS